MHCVLITVTVLSDLAPATVPARRALSLLSRSRTPSTFRRSFSHPAPVLTSFASQTRVARSGTSVGLKVRIPPRTGQVLSCLGAFRVLLATHSRQFRLFMCRFGVVPLCTSTVGPLILLCAATRYPSFVVENKVCYKDANRCFVLQKAAVARVLSVLGLMQPRRVITIGCPLAEFFKQTPGYEQSLIWHCTMHGISVIFGRVCVNKIGTRFSHKCAWSFLCARWLLAWLWRTRSVGPLSY